MKTQIPIYRAKKIDSDEYVEGYYIRENTGHFIQGCNDFRGGFKIIDQSTLAIHFPDMLDSEGTKIFASLSEDGKGGSTMKHTEWEGKDEPQNQLYCVWENMRVNIVSSPKDWHTLYRVADKSMFKVKGIKK